MRKLIKLATPTLAFAALAASSASATTGPAMLQSRSPIGIGSNHHAVSGNHTKFPGPQFSIPATGGGTAVGACAEGSFTFTAPTTNTVGANPALNGCTLTVAGLALVATVEQNCEWKFTFANSIFNSTMGAGSGVTVDVPCPTTITISGVGCTLHLTSISNLEFGTTQNITTTGANDTSASPWGSKIIGSASGLHYTTTLAGGGSTCGVPATGNVTYQGTAAVRNLWGSL